MSDRWGDSQRDRDALDRHITGNWGEDQFSGEQVIRVSLNHLTGVADQDFSCASEEEARSVLLEYGAAPSQIAAALEHGGEIAFRDGGTISVYYEEE